MNKEIQERMSNRPEILFSGLSIGIEIQRSQEKKKLNHRDPHL
jgi:hypothetical protein